MAKSNFIAKQFHEYKKINDIMEKWLRINIGILNSFDEYGEDLSKEDVIEKKSGKNIKEIFENWKRDDGAILRLCNELKSVIENENKEIAPMFARSSHDMIQFANDLTRRIITYNNNKHEILSKISSVLPSLFRNLSDLIEVPEIVMKNAAQSIVDFYLSLEKLIENRNVNKGTLFNELSIILIHLSEYLSQKGSIHRNNQNIIISEIGIINSNTKLFVENFFNKLGTDTVVKLNKLLKNNDITLGKENSESYSTTKNKKDLDKFMKEVLLILFKDSKNSKIEDIFGKKSSNSGTSGDDWYDDVEIERINSITGDDDVIKSLLMQLNDLKDSKDNNWNDSFSSAKSDILNDIKIIAKFINENSNKFNGGDSLINDLKISFDNFKKDISDLNALKRYCNTLINLLESVNSSLSRD